MTSAAETAARQAAERACYQVLAEHSVLGTILVDPAGGIVDNNEAFDHLAGVAQHALRGRSIETVFSGSITADQEATLLTGDGRQRPVHVLTHDLPHNYRLYIAIDRSAVAASDERFGRAFSDAGLGMALVTRSGELLRVNAALTDIVGYSEEELLGQTGWTLLHPEDLDATRRVWQRFDAGETAAITEEKRYVHKDGHPVWVTVTLSPMRIATDERRLFLVQIEDISERRQLATTLIEREEQLRTALDANRAAAFGWDSVSGLLWYSDALPELLGYPVDRPPEQLRDIPEAFVADDRDRIRAALLPRGEGPIARFAHRGRIRLRDGNDRYIELSGARERRSDATTVLRAIVRDVTEELAMERARIATEQRLDLVLDAVQDGIWDWDGTTERTYFSRHYFAMLGYEATERVAAGDTFANLLHPDDRERVLRDLTEQHRQDTGTAFTNTFRMRRADGSWAWIESRGRVVARDHTGQATRIVGTHRDVSDTRALEDQFRQAQKMEAIGKLAGGIAHDFNNLLTTIAATAELLSEDLANDPRRQDVENIALAAARARTLTRQLLAFSRQEVEQVGTVDVGEVIRTIEPLLHRMMAAGQQFILDQPPGTRWVHLDPAQLELALLNLVGNARDAMPDGGEVRLRLDYHPHVGPNDRWRDRPHLRLTVSDTGTGIDQDVVNRIFEPFFTTKPMGEGTGLGLATVYAFVSRSGGEISVTSSTGGGTTFTILLPTVAAPPVSDVTLPPRTTAPRRSSRILLVDDDAAVRTTIRRLLEHHHFQVDEAADAAAALAALEAGSFDLVLSDHAMPGQTGQQLLMQIIERWPEIRVILMSGFAHDGAARRAISGREIPFLAKPFTTDELLDMIGNGP